MKKLLVIFTLVSSLSLYAQDNSATENENKAQKNKKTKNSAVKEVTEEVQESASDYDWNIKTNPISLLIGATNAEVNYAPFEHFTFGVGGLRWSTEILDIEFTATEYHLRFDYWFNKAFEQGWYVGAQISRLGMELTTEVSGVDFTGNINSTGYLAQFGYHWQWDNFNIDFGTYFGYYDFDSSITLEDVSGNTQDETVPAFGAIGAEFFIGWAF